MKRLTLAAAAAAACGLMATSLASAQTYSLVIGVDGMGSYGLEAGTAPNMLSVKAGTWAAGYRGGYTLSAYAGGVVGTATEQPTLSGPGWSTLNSGVWANRHGVTDNTFNNRNFAAYPTYLKLLESRSAATQTTAVASWAPINTYIMGDNDGANPNVDAHSATNEDDAATASGGASAVAALPAGGSGAVFLHFDDVDAAGHSTGAYSPGYLAQVADVDGQIGQVLSAVRSRLNFAAENWQVMVVSDHGHLAAGGHGGQSQLERTVPILVSSKSQSAGAFTAAAMQPSQVDVAPTVLSHFGAPKPAYMAGQSLVNAAAPTIGTSLGNGLLTHLSFDGNASGTFASTGGTATGTVTYDAGRFGQAAKVATYGGGRVVLNDDIAAGLGTTGDLALSMWVKFDGVTSDPAFFSNKNWNSGGNTGINLANQSATAAGGLDANLKGATGTRADVEPYSGFEAGAWHHVLLNVDRDGRTSLFVDGALFGDNATSQGSLDGAYNFTFFNDGTGTYAGGSFTNLTIDEFSAWNRLLTPDEITYLSNNPLTSSVVPEPASPAVDAAGAGLLALRRFRRRTLRAAA